MKLKYTPNFKDSRVQSRIKKALGFVRGCLSDTKPHSWSTRYIDKYLGLQHHDLSKWLRRHLLIVTSDRYSMGSGICKEYMLNKTGYDYITDCLSGRTTQSLREWESHLSERYKQSLSDLVEDHNDENDTESRKHLHTYPSVTDLHDLPLITQWAQEEFGLELKTLTFNYEDKSSRLWHPLQHVRKQYKKTIFLEAGLKYQYDIQCCAPTLIHQYAQKCDMDLYLFALREYIKNRAIIRHEIAQQAQLPEHVIKVIINALFSGAQLGHNPTSAIYKLLDGDYARIEFLKQHLFIIQLREDIKVCWEYIKPFMSRRSVTDTRTGKERMIPISSKQKWGIYFDLERKVLNSMNEYLSESNNKCFLEHDGWTCRDEVDINALEEYVKDKTDYKIKIECETL